MANIYREPETIQQKVAAGHHREVVGGEWDAMGEWQLNFLKAHGLEPRHRLLDVGCGSLRGGVPIVRYLAPDRYAGVDAWQELLDAGYDVELAGAGLQHKLDRAKLIQSERFDFSSLTPGFEFALAQSLFTHVDLNHVRLCLNNLVSVMAPDSRLFATYFEAPEDLPLDETIDRGEGIRTAFDQNPYHYRFSDLERTAQGLAVTVTRLGDVGHPRGQFMAEFRFHTRAGTDTGRTPTRDLDADAALSLQAGADHYRAYVGPPRRFDFMSSTQLALLHAMGLREEDKVLDVGCGSLRLGRLLIPLLREGCYFGVEPVRWLVDEAISRELGWDAIALKQPRFSYRSDFDFSAFGESFDYIIAQSVATHTGPDLLAPLIAGAARCLADDGYFLFSYMRDDDAGAQPDGWHYPDCTWYPEAFIRELLGQAGLASRPIPWFHPAASWMLAARSETYLPGEAEAGRLRGYVFERPTSDKGYVTRR